MEDRLCDCVKLAVDCLPNDPTPIGFDFYIKEEDVEDIIKFIVVTLQGLGLPLMGINVVEKIRFGEHNCDSKMQILSSINGQAPLIKAQAEKYKNPTPTM